MRAASFLAATAALVAVAFSAAASDVETLTSKNFDGVIGKEDLVLVKVRPAAAL